MLTFICAVYNEANEVVDLVNHVYDYVDKLIFCDDGSDDDTPLLVENLEWQTKNKVTLLRINHTGLPETVKNRALELADDGWILMLDADERFASGVLDKIQAWLNSDESSGMSYVYFNQFEIIDGAHVRTFQKSKLYKKSAITFSTTIHEDDRFTGEGIFKEDWVVLHRKTRSKQINREKEYLETYKKLLANGKIDQDRYNWLVGLHHYIK
jgi:glycosyltransferase involved in cell wall biosynthesis